MSKRIGKCVMYKKTRTRARVNEELSQELHKTVIKKINVRKVHTRFDHRNTLEGGGGGGGGCQFDSLTL